MQTKTHSFIESLGNVLIGYIIAICTQLVVFPLFGMNPPLRDNLLIGLCFMAVALIRNYIIRRWFTKRTENISYPTNRRPSGQSK